MGGELEGSTRLPEEPGAGDSEGPTRRASEVEEPGAIAQAAADDEFLKASLLAGSGGKIGRFHVLRLLGEGGMGMVFAAYDEELDRKLAIKLLRTLPGDDNTGRARLLREAQALARLSHPNVVTVYEVGEFGTQVFIAMEFVLGQTLHEWLRGGLRPWREVVRIFLEAGRGLAVAHAAEILHRDFKPANVLLGDDGRVRVLDFGLALAQGRDGESEVIATHVRLQGPNQPTNSHARISQELTEAGSIVGTPAYMAPERFIFGQPVDTRADQFSFCVALYEALYGARPFVGKKYEEIRDAILVGVPGEASRGSKVPGWLRKVVLRGLAREPNDRWPNMEALLAALQRDPDRSRRQWLVGLTAAGVLVAGGYGLAQATQAQGGVVACADARARLHAVWDERRDEVERSLLATNAVYAGDTWTRIAGRLDAHADAWAAVHTEACQAHARGEQSANLLDLRMACLERRRGELAALVARLARADSETVRAAAASVEVLTPPARCSDGAALLAATPMPESEAAAARVAELQGRLSEARAALVTAKLDEAAEIVGEVVAGAEALGFRPLLAEALAVRGRLEYARATYEPARATLTEALWLADSVRDDVLVAETMASLVSLVGDRLARFDEALAWRRHADAVIARLGEASPGHAHLLWAFGVTLYSRGRPAEALGPLRRALEIDEALGEAEERRVMRDLLALGTAEFVGGRHAEARQYDERALALGERIYGPRHPEVARIVGSLATVLFSMGELDAAEPLQERALAITEAALGHGHPAVAVPLANLASLHATRGQLLRARPLFERALAIDEKVLGAGHPDLAPSLHNLAIVAGELDDLVAARAFTERAVKIREKNFPADSPLVAESIAELGYVALREENYAAAIRDLERAIAVLVADPAHTHQLALPQARLNLARALRGAGKRERARAAATQAAVEFRALNAAQYATHLAEIDEMLVELR